MGYWLAMFTKINVLDGHIIWFVGLDYFLNPKIMASESKKRKMKNSYTNRGFALKEKLMKLKRVLFYNSSKRKELKKITDK